MPSLVALVPARGGSLRIRGKNIRRLSGHPLLAYTLAAASESGVFDHVVVSTDDEATAEVALHYGAEVPFLRPAQLAGATSADIEWIQHAVATLPSFGISFDAFSILRPTSPLRTAGTIRRAVEQFLSDGGVDSLRAVERCKQHPGKMWVIEGLRMRPLLDDGGASPPWHSTPYQALPPVHVQNASLEIAWTHVVAATGTIAGDVIMPFLTEGDEGFDLNDGEDWWVLERLLTEGRARLPTVLHAPFPESR